MGQEKWFAQLRRNNDPWGVSGPVEPSYWSKKVGLTRGRAKNTGGTEVKAKASWSPWGGMRE